MSEKKVKNPVIQKKADEFLKISSQFRLGELPTESPHPKTSNLSDLVANNLQDAVNVLKEIDLEAIGAVRNQEEKILEMKSAIEDTLNDGCKIFLVGCGATGRLSLALEVFWRKERAETQYVDSVVSFMAGGDTALIKSIENFEDYPDFAAKQLRELGFNEGDLLIACTEGGETPFVIGATETALEISKRNPFFLYCNPDDILMGLTDRTTRVLENRSIKKINLFVGPMALSGSTRMQASTVLMYGVGLALLNAFKDVDISKDVDDLVRHIDNTNFSFLVSFIENEAGIYKRGGYLLYKTHDDLGISILTDTTERAPTFTLEPFENFFSEAQPSSLVYLCLPDAPDSRSAWKKLLYREPRALGWSEYAITDKQYLYGFNFSEEVIEKRQDKIHPANMYTFEIKRADDAFNFDFQGVAHGVDIEGLNLLQQQVLLKILLNTHSTLIMGKLGRYESNLMTWVTTSNNKLIDRAVRYIEILIKKKGIDLPYGEILYYLFDEISKEYHNKSLVLETFKRIMEEER
jgi:N-acetylmuramic acid 6-phosphate etherase